MKNHGFIKVASGIPFGKVAGIDYNKKLIIKMITDASNNNSSIIVFPELSITSYTCSDLFQETSIIDASIDAILDITNKTKNLQILAIVGLPIINNNQLFNCACAISNGKILGIIPKSYLPGYREFYEPRWFSEGKNNYEKEMKIDNQIIPFGTDLLFKDRNNKYLIIGIEICEDLWVPIPPSSYQALSGATILCNLSASNILVGKNDYRKELIGNQSARCFAGYIYSSSGMGESTTDIVFDSYSSIYENGILLSESRRFLREDQIIYADLDIEKLIIERIKHNSFKSINKQFRTIEFQSLNKTYKINRCFNPYPFIPDIQDKLNERCEEIFNIQSSGLAKRVEANPGIKAIIGVSGGLDSTLSLLVSINTFQILNRNLKDIIAVTMPGFGTTSRTYKNTVNLCKKFDITFKEIDIKDLSNLMFKSVNHPVDKQDTVYENIQARYRTFILMTIANQYGGMVVGTGDLSEIALGWSTYNGDHMSMYNVNSSVPKTLVKFLVKWIANNKFDNEIKNILIEILNQPISPELLPAEKDKISQNTEEKIGPYELHDFYLYYFIRFGFSVNKIRFLAENAFHNKYDAKTIKKWLNVFLKRFFANQWKRDCFPAGPKVGSVDLSPRGSWRMPSETELQTFMENEK